MGLREYIYKAWTRLEVPNCRSDTAGYGDTPRYAGIRELCSIPRISILKKEKKHRDTLGHVRDTFGTRPGPKQPRPNPVYLTYLQELPHALVSRTRCSLPASQVTQQPFTSPLSSTSSSFILQICLCCWMLLAGLLLACAAAYAGGAAAHACAAASHACADG